MPEQAACYGRAFCAADAFPRDRIVTVCRQLRILNALREPDVGLPLTAAQVRISPRMFLQGVATSTLPFRINLQGPDLLHKVAVWERNGER